MAVKSVFYDPQVESDVERGNTDINESIGSKWTVIAVLPAAYPGARAEVKLYKPDPKKSFTPRPLPG